DDLDRGREIAGFAEAERETRGCETDHAARQCVAHRRDAPYADRERVADACAETVDDGAGAKQAERVSGLERGDDVTVFDFGPADLFLQERREHAEDLPVDVVDRRRAE